MIDPIRPERVGADAFLACRRSRLERRLGRRLVPPPPTGLPASHRRFLREEAEELYWNELSWASGVVGVGRAGLGSETGSPGGIARATPAVDADPAERVFAAFLTFIDGLLLRETGPADDREATPRPGVVEDILLLLADRCLDPTDAEDAVTARERALTVRLVDLVLYRLHVISTTARPSGRPPRPGESGPAHVGEDG